MEEKDVNSIVGAVTKALSKLNEDTVAKKEAVKDKDTLEEVFKCPDCDAPVKGGIAYCQSCGCSLEWEE